MTHPIARPTENPVPPSDSGPWDSIAASPQFRNLLAVKRAFIVPAFVFFFIYYFALAVLIGYAPRLASLRVVGAVTLAYLFALSQFVAGWIIAALYLLVSAKFDALSNHILTAVASSAPPPGDPPPRSAQPPIPGDN